MKEKILAKIAELQAKREGANIVPAHVLTTDIINSGFNKPYEALNELYLEGKVEWHRTINDIALYNKRKRRNQIKRTNI